MLIGPNGRPIVKSEGPTGRLLILHEIMVKGRPEIKIEARGQWFKDETPPEQLRGRLLMCNYFTRVATSIVGDMLGTFIDSDVNKEVQNAINQLAKGENNGV